MDLPTVLYIFAINIIYMFVHVCVHRHNTVWQWCNVMLYMCVVNGRVYSMGVFWYLCRFEYIYSTVGRSIADIYDPRRHIYRGAKRKYAEVVYRGYGPTYRIIYTIYYGECATDEPFA